jgi:hypothetical protein
MVGAMYISGTIYIGADAVTGAPSCGPGESHGYLTVFGRCINVNETMYVGTLTRAGGLMLGAAFAMVWRPIAIMRSPMKLRGRRVDLCALASLVGLAWLMNTLFLLDKNDLSYNSWLFRGGFLLTGVFSIGVIAATAHRRSWIGRLLAIGPLRWIGTRSYGMYLYHWPIYQIMRNEGQPLQLRQFAIAMLITIPITELSYRLIELPIRKGRLSQFLASQRASSQRPARSKEARFRRRRTFVLGSALAVLTGFATVSVATADVLCVTQVECDSEKGAQAIDAGVASSVPAVPSSATSTSLPLFSGKPVLDGSPPTTVAPSTVPPTTINPIDLLPTYAFGESVMLGAVGELTAGGIVVNAAVSRQGTNMAELMERLRVENALGRIVVIQTGTNGPVNDATLDRIMAALPAELTPTVVLMTVRAPRSWITDNNERIRAMPTRYANVVVLDWEAASAGILDQLSGDGYHLNTDAAKQFYANLIFDAIGRPDLKK